MSLAPGTRLGPYEIAAPLGAGGMGEVFRARDTRLDRTVAIKILPPVLAGDPQFRERFDREARAISALNHPHICTLHDIGDERGTAFLVMEHVDGETLAARLERGALPVAEALAIAIQIADALDAAHRRGIVHRDVKPANIMIVRRPGSSGPPLIKLLDFGLARTAPAVTSSSGQSIGATMTGGLTGAGTILGTIQYMAPEQVEGLEADSRTDIFALGVVLYEMVTAQRAFSGHTPASLISAILKDHPPAISVQQPLAPASLDRTVRRCLAKDPDDRWQTMRDLKAELQWVAESRATSVPTQVPRTKRRIAERLAWSAIIIALLLFGGWALLRDRPQLSAIRATFEIPPALDLVGGGDRLVAISPDGRRVAFSGTSSGVNRIYLREIASFDALPLHGTEGGGGPFFSPDGRWLGFVADGQLKIIPIAGGAAIPLAKAASRGAVWAPDGTIIFTSDIAGGLSRVSAAGGTVEPLTTLAANERSHRWPSLLPDGKTILFTIQPPGTRFEDALVAVRSMATGEQKIIVRGGTSPAYLDSGHLVFGRAGALLAVPFDPGRFEAGSTPARILDGVASVSGSGAVHYAVASGGSLAYLTGDLVENQSELVWVNRRGESTAVSEGRRAFLEIALSPDGRRVAATIDNPGGNPDVWVYELTSGAFTRLTFSATPEVGAAWTPDGLYVSYRTTRDPLQLVKKRFDGSGPEEVLVAGVSGLSATLAGAWHHSADWVTYGNSDDIVVLPLRGERKPQAFLSTSAVELFPVFSPDGRWLAYQSNESGRFEVYVQPFPATGARWQVSSEAGVRPIWARDGSELFYRSADRMMAVRIQPGPSFVAGPPQKLFEGPYSASYDVARDGRFLMIRNPARRGPSQLRFVLNWRDEVRSLTRPQ